MGLKENIILGQLIPAGTGLRHYYEMLVTSDKGNIFGREFKEQIEQEKIATMQEQLYKDVIEDVQAEMTESIGLRGSEVADLANIDESELDSPIS